MLARPEMPSAVQEPVSPFHVCRLLVDQLGLLSWEKRSVTAVVVGSSHQSPCWGVSRLRSAQSITFLWPVWSDTKGSPIGGGCHEANDLSCGNGCALSGLFYSCTDQGFDCDRCAIVPV